MKAWDKLASKIRGGGQAMQWTILTSAPKGQAGEQWGDTFFARDLAAALRRSGQRARVASRAGVVSPRRDEDDVVLVLRGLRAVQPPPERSATWILWVISHPELVTEEELNSYDAVFVASEHWQAPQGVQVTPLLQATDPARFGAGFSSTDSVEVLFVGSTRGQFRPAVRGALRSNRAGDLRVYGVGWEEFIDSTDSTVLGGEFLPNEDLPGAYANASIVLNDHHREMADDGFLSNRLFDAVASGARVLSDRARGIEDVFGDCVVVFDDEEHLAQLLSQPIDEVFPSHEVRRQSARRIARDHSFDARAQVLIDRATQLRRAA